MQWQLPPPPKKQQLQDKPISFPEQRKVGMLLSARRRWQSSRSCLWLAFVCFKTSKNVFRINTYFQKGTPQLVTWNSLSACRSNSLESIKTPKGTPCSPLNLLVLLLSRQSLPVPPSPPFLSFVWSPAKPVIFYHSTLLFMQQSSFHQPLHARRPGRKLHYGLLSSYTWA